MLFRIYIVQDCGGFNPEGYLSATGDELIPRRAVAEAGLFETSQIEAMLEACDYADCKLLEARLERAN